MRWRSRRTLWTPKPAAGPSRVSRRRDFTRARSRARSASIRIFALDLGQTVTVTYPRHGLEDGRNFVVVGMVEDSSQNEITLDLWG